MRRALRMRDARGKMREPGPAGPASSSPLPHALSPSLRRTIGPVPSPFQTTTLHGMHAHGASGATEAFEASGASGASGAYKDSEQCSGVFEGADATTLQALAYHVPCNPRSRRQPAATLQCRCTLLPTSSDTRPPGAPSLSEALGTRAKPSERERSLRNASEALGTRAKPSERERSPRNASEALGTRAKPSEI